MTTTSTLKPCRLSPPWIGPLSLVPILMSLKLTPDSLLVTTLHTSLLQVLTMLPQLPQNLSLFVAPWFHHLLPIWLHELITANNPCPTFTQTQPTQTQCRASCNSIPDTLVTNSTQTGDNAPLTKINKNKTTINWEEQCVKECSDTKDYTPANCSDMEKIKYFEDQVWTMRSSALVQGLGFSTWLLDFTNLKAQDASSQLLPTILSRSSLRMMSTNLNFSSLSSIFTIALCWRLSNSVGWLWSLWHLLPKWHFVSDWMLVSQSLMSPL